MAVTDAGHVLRTDRSGARSEQVSRLTSHTMVTLRRGVKVSFRLGPRGLVRWPLGARSCRHVWCIPLRPRPLHVRLEIHNVAGRRVAVLADHVLDAGPHAIRWDAADQPSGLCFRRLTTEGIAELKAMVLIR